MPVTPSPLRYPGGKTKIYDYVKKILDLNDLHGTYIEPFAGGAGLALKLLLNKDVSRIVINDSDPAIYSFWNSVLNHSQELCSFIAAVPLNYAEWLRQRNIYFNQSNYTELEIGQATLYLNRTNMSGVIKGGLIGGIEQTGNYKMDARFNREDIISKINTIAEMKESIDLYQLDVFEFIKPPTLRHYYKAFINFDPPYVNKGGQLYMNFFGREDHINLEKAISSCKRKWMVTYDVCDLVQELYSGYRKGYLDVTYSANGSRKAQELVYFSPNLSVPDEYLESNSR